MLQYTKKWEDQPIDPVDTMYKINQVNLVKWLKHLRDLNHPEKDVQAFDAYNCLLENIQRGTIFMDHRHFDIP